MSTADKLDAEERIDQKPVGSRQLQSCGFPGQICFFSSIVNHVCCAFFSVLKSKSGKKRAEFAVSLSGAGRERERERERGWGLYGLRWLQLKVAGMSHAGIVSCKRLFTN